jgi:UDP-N-acetylglucosamine:LPS N-acetylglucosamine transferase
MPTPDESKLILLCAGGTGGHLFPAESLAVVLAKRGLTVDLATDHRAAHFKFPARNVHLIPSATLRGRDPLSIAKTAALLTYGTWKAGRVLKRIRPAAVVGFGGYPTVPPMMAATMKNIPTVLHEQNGVMGRANRMLAARVSAIATGFRTLKNADAFQDKITFTGNPVRPAVTCEPFFSDLPARMAAAHLIVSRSGASTVAELSAIGRPAILVPLPHAQDQDQLANAGALESVGGAITIVQPDFTPERLAADIARLAAASDQLATMAAAARSAGTLDAAEHLADLVMKTAGI